MKADLLKLLEYIFKSSEFNVRKSGPNGILIEQNGYKAFVMCSLQGDYEEIKNFSKKTDENTGIYVISQKATQEFNEYAKSLRVNLWDRDELALQAGRALLQNMEKKAGIFPSPELPQTSELSQAPELPLEKAD
ncbi:MAG: hypothetical protein PHD26_09150, partial [Methanosarcinaceae archaeon]|nr:hypothetical protein [Methanosarcinaceae archaeon]